VIPALTVSHRVVAPDLPGHGASTVGEAPLDADRVLDWLGELIEQTCTRPPVVVGQLVGGAIAARFAAERNGALGRLVLVVPFGLARFEPTPAFGAALTGFLAAPGESTHDELWKHCVFDFDGLRARPATRWEQVKAYNLDLATSGSVSTAIQALIEQFGFPAIPDEVLRRIAVPTSLIWGAHDSVIPPSVGEQASGRFGWPLNVLAQAGNEPALETPKSSCTRCGQPWERRPRHDRHPARRPRRPPRRHAPARRRARLVGRARDLERNGGRCSGTRRPAGFGR
jgi:pimeloyl-ACP methyl ester carboxylesterase